MTERRIVCHTPTPGKQSTSIPKWKYDVVSEAILKIVPTTLPGVCAKDLPDLVSQQLDAETKAKLGSIAWHTTTVKLHMEVEGEIRRTPKLKPQHITRC